MLWLQKGLTTLSSATKRYEESRETYREAGEQLANLKTVQEGYEKLLAEKNDLSLRLSASEESIKNLAAENERLKNLVVENEQL